MLGAGLCSWSCTGAELENPDDIYTWTVNTGIYQGTSGGTTSAGGSPVATAGGTVAGSPTTSTGGAAPTGGAGSPATTGGAGSPSVAGAGTSGMATAGTATAGSTSTPTADPYPMLSDGTVCDPLVEIASSCGIAGCHDATSAPLSGNLDLATAGYIDRMLDVPSDICPDQLLINSTNYQASLFYTKVNKTQPAACGLAMPYSAGYPASFSANQQCLETWVKNLVNGF